ncbi:MAG TPA: AI-2E family transporter [Candidatus Aquicultor sp.]|jgi:predicted PurR-regulated permease PerM
MYFRVADWLKAILFAIAIVLLYILAGTIAHTILLFVAAGFIVFIIHPLVAFLANRGMKRILAILITYLLFFGILALISVILAPTVAAEITAFIRNFPGYIRILSRETQFIQSQLRGITFLRQFAINPDTILGQLSGIVTSQVRNVFTIIPSVITFVTDVVLVFILSLYFLIYLPNMDKSLRVHLHKDLVPVYDRFLVAMESAFARYLFGQFIFMATIGLFFGIGMWIVDLPYPALFGVWAGLTEIIPVLGPVLGAIPAIIVALTIKPILALYVAIVFIIIQQLENNVLAPVVLGGTVGLNPLIIFFGIIAGGELGGIVGIFLAVPVLVFVSNILRFIRDNFKYERVPDGLDRISIKKYPKEQSKPAAKA